MTRAEILLEAIKRMPAGKVFGYSDLSDTGLKHNAMVIEMNRLVQRGEVARVLRGRFVASNGHKDVVSAPDIIHAVCHYRNKVCGYETGPSVWEKWGLIPAMKKRKEFYVSIVQMRPAQQHGNIIIRFKRTRLDPARYNHEIMQFLDALESINTISLQTKTNVLQHLENRFLSWNESYRTQLPVYALAYRPVARALAGSILQNNGYTVEARRLAASLHPASTYIVKTDCSHLRNTTEWRIISQKETGRSIKKVTTSKLKSK